MHYVPLSFPVQVIANMNLSVFGAEENTKCCTVIIHWFTVEKVHNTINILWEPAYDESVT